jgi:hypothetical protein
MSGMQDVSTARRTSLLRGVTRFNRVKGSKVQEPLNP